MKLQQEVFRPEEKELTRAEYERLCQTAQKKNNERLCLILQTICSTGIRISELPFVTVETVHRGKAVVCLKGEDTGHLYPKRFAEKTASVFVRE